MNGEKNPYEILQVHNDAEKEVIDAAYRSLSRKYHPDINKSSNASEKMKEINWAYEILGNEPTRKKWDQIHKQSPYTNNSKKEEYKTEEKDSRNRRNTTTSSKKRSPARNNNPLIGLVVFAALALTLVFLNKDYLLSQNEDNIITPILITPIPQETSTITFTAKPNNPTQIPVSTIDPLIEIRKEFIDCATKGKVAESGFVVDFINGNTFVLFTDEKLYKKITLLNTKLIPRTGFWDPEIGNVTRERAMEYEDGIALSNFLGINDSKVTIFMDETDRSASTSSYPRYVFAGDTFINFEMIKLGLLEIELSETDNSGMSEILCKWHFKRATDLQSGWLTG
jgi:hypothetical protein